MNMQKDGGKYMEEFFEQVINFKNPILIFLYGFFLHSLWRQTAGYYA